MNVFGGGMSPLISYKYDNASKSWKKHYNIYDHLGTLAQTYKQSGLGATPTSMQTHNPFGSERWTNKNLTTKESTLLNWVGKEKDNESKLGDHGVRKYEYETGRFISIDPLWGKYFGWTPYQYSMNSPVMLVDVDGNELEVGSELQDNLVYSVAPEYRQYIGFDKNGTVNKDLIGSVNPTSITDPIFRAVQMASLSSEKAIIENNEKYYGIFKGVMTPTSLDGKGVEHLSKFAGYTVFPKSKNSGFYTDDGNTHIYIDPTFSEFSQSQTLIREVREHFLNSLIGLPYQHNTEGKSHINLYDEHKRTGDEVKNNSIFNPVPYREEK